jgi:hypothetical protein
MADGLSELVAGLLSEQSEDSDNAANDGAEHQEHTAHDDAAHGDEHSNPDEGTGSEHGEAGEGEGHETDTEAEPSAEPFYTVKVDGKDERVTLKEALAGYQRLADYTRKTQEIAAARQQAEAEAAQAREQRSAYSQLLDVLKTRLGPESELTADQWNALRQSDPAAYAAQWTDYQRRVEARRAIDAEQSRVREAEQQENLARLKTHLDGQRAKLLDALPVLKDPEKGPKEMAAIRDYAKQSGYSDAEIAQAADHRMIVVMNKARMWDQHQASLKAAKTKVEQAPTLPAPGARQPQQARGEKARAEQMKRFERTGKVEDAVSLLLAPKKGPKGR